MKAKDKTESMPLPIQLAPHIRVRLVRDVSVPPFPKTWGWVRVVDGRREAHGFKSPSEARKWAKVWNCLEVK